MSEDEREFDDVEEDDLEEWLAEKDSIDASLDDVNDEFDEFMEKHEDVLDDDDAVVPEEDIVVSQKDIRSNFRNTKIQFNGNVYSVSIPRNVIRATNIAKSDEVEWGVRDVDENEAEIIMRIEKRGYRLPAEDRTGGR